ncbi:MAG: phospholipase [Proteobacteria bacterium]|nr:phospholipase [Pseudomonadota bacterium]
MTTPEERAAGLLAPLLAAMDTLAAAARHLDPPHLPDLAESVEDADAALRAGLAAFDAAPWPEDLAAAGEALRSAAQAMLDGFAGLRTAAMADDLRLAYRATRGLSRAQAALYPLAAGLPSVSRAFLEPGARDDAGLLARLSAAGAGPEGAGVAHHRGEPGARGGYALYVPEYLDPARPAPAVVALHGGSGNGAAFLWTWLAEARTRGMVLIAPTALGTTWSLMEPETDAANIAAILNEVGVRQALDPTRLLLTGMSDGGTFALGAALRTSLPFTHLAPVATGFHPMLVGMGNTARLAGLPVYLAHGALDWMFAVSRARAVAEALAAHGAKIVFREIADLSHAYPREENPRIAEWFLS